MKYLQKYAEVALPVPIDQTFTYSVQEKMKDSAQVGIRVLVPFGKRKLTGYIVDFNTYTSIKNIKPKRKIIIFTF